MDIPKEHGDASQKALTRTVCEEIVRVRHFYHAETKMINVKILPIIGINYILTFMSKIHVNKAGLGFESVTLAGQRTSSWRNLVHYRRLT